MRILTVVIGWACVSGSWALSSGEVSCQSCGYECQSACGTRNFRACCFNFQRRRRSDGVMPRLSDASDQNHILDGSSYFLTDVPEDLFVKQQLRELARNAQNNQIKSVLTQILQESSEEDAHNFPELLMQPDSSLPLGKLIDTANPLLLTRLQNKYHKQNHFDHTQNKKNTMNTEVQEMTLGKLLTAVLRLLPVQVLKETIHLPELTSGQQGTQDNNPKNLSEIRK